MIKKGILIMIFCCMAAAPLFAYSVKGFEWGESFYSIERQLEKRGKVFTWTPEIDTMVYEDSINGETCEVALLFTPNDRYLAGVAFMWAKAAISEKIKIDLIVKYGDPLAFDRSENKNKYYIWTSPTDRYEKIILQKKPASTVLGYYGGRYYEQYKMERKRMAKNNSARKTGRMPSFF